MTRRTITMRFGSRNPNDELLLKLRVAEQITGVEVDVCSDGEDWVCTGTSDELAAKVSDAVSEALEASDKQPGEPVGAGSTTTGGSEPQAGSASTFYARARRRLQEWREVAADQGVKALVSEGVKSIMSFFG